MMKTVKILMLLLLLTGVYLASGSAIWQHIADKNWMASYIAEQGTPGTILLIGSGIVFTGCGGPRQLIAFTFGFTFGTTIGILFALLSSLTSAIIVYYLSGFFLKATLTKYFGKRYPKFRKFVRRQPFIKILTLRIFPLGSNLLTNLLSGISGVPILAFITATLAGYLPQTVIFSLAGAGIGAASRWQLLTSIILGLFSLLLTHYLYRRYQHSLSVLSKSKQGCPS